jgi:membrane glycosyltransferase
MVLRRLLVAAIVALTAGALCAALFGTLAPGGWTFAKLVMFGSVLGAAPWVGFCAANGLIGFVLRLPRPTVPPPGPPPAAMPRTAIAVTVRDENLTPVLRAMRRLLDGLDATPAGAAFALFILSDTPDPEAGAAEAGAVARFAAADRDPTRVRYRRRAENAGFKAGNVLDFVDRLADGFAWMLVLDADSEMTPEAVFRLARVLHDEPGTGIVQHLTVGLPAASCFPRLFQFGMRAGMRTWASSLSWWQGDSCVYWGHNALIRIAPFRAHARLPLLPGGRRILSHDQVEAALLRGAGWGVRLVAEEDGSFEANPPALPEFMRRELRWMAGNFEYRHLLTMPGLRPMGRWQLVQAILLFGCTPFYLAFLLGAATAAASDRSSPFPFRWALATTLIWACGLHAPKLLGYLEVLLSRDKRARYGGAARLLGGAIVEIGFTLMLDAINTLAKSLATARIAVGWRAAWGPQNRHDRGVPWAEAIRLLWPQTVLGMVVFGCFALAGWTTVIWAAPFLAGLIVAVPFCVLTADPRVGRWMRRWKVAAPPEEWRRPETRDDHAMIRQSAG